MARIMIVEDEALIGMLLEEMLIGHGHEVVAQASTLTQALELAETKHFDVALLDISLHGEAVFPVAELLLQRAIPFIFTTGYGAAGLPLEWSDYPVFCKPYNIQALNEMLSQLAAPRS